MGKSPVIVPHSSHDSSSRQRKNAKTKKKMLKQAIF